MLKSINVVGLKSSYISWIWHQPMYICIYYISMYHRIWMDADFMEFELEQGGGISFDSPWVFWWFLHQIVTDEFCVEAAGISKKTIGSKTGLAVSVWLPVVLHWLRQEDEWLVCCWHLPAVPAGKEARKEWANLRPICTSSESVVYLPIRSFFPCQSLWSSPRK